MAYVKLDPPGPLKKLFLSKDLDESRCVEASRMPDCRAGRSLPQIKQEASSSILKVDQGTEPAEACHTWPGAAADLLLAHLQKIFGLL
jgi:hypothetical protein